MTRSAVPAAERRAFLCIAASARDGWEGAVRDWFDAVLPNAWLHRLPSLVVVPTGSHAHALKARLLRERRSHLGVQFVTPAGLRELFARDGEPCAASREHLRLLLAIAAEETLRAERDGEVAPDHLAAKSVVRTPDHLLRALDRLETAGWDFNRLQMRSFAPIVRRFREHLRGCRFGLVGNVDRAALASTQSAPPRFANVLISGLSGAYWPYWFLLRAAVEAAEAATVVLEYPRDNSSADLAWIGSWEEALGEATPVSGEDENASDSLFSEVEMRGASRSTPRFTFLVGANASQQAQAIALHCVRFLADARATRIGVVFAQAGALPRLVANALAARAIPHNDGIAHPQPGLFESAEWRAWLELQRGPRIESFLHFISTFENCAAVFPTVSAGRFERVLRDAYKEVLIDDLEVLREFCATSTSERNETVAVALRAFHFLPARATLSAFLEATRDALAHLGWSQHWTEIANRSRDWPGKLDVEFSRTLFLRWLEEIASTFGAARDAAGDHPYARVHLLTVPQAHGQEWSHLIFAGWNEGSWPPAAISEFARDGEIDAFNAAIQQLNQRATKRGRHGEGHISVREGHTLYLGPTEQRQIALRQFDSLLESASDGVAFSATLVQENAPERLWNPSELFTRLYQQTYQAPLTGAAMSELQRATAAWLEKSQTLTTKGDLPSVFVEQTRVAFDARRDPNTAAGEYDFGFRSAPLRTPMFSVSDLERMVSTPALVWMKRYLGVEADDEAGNPWSAATGQWVHAWLARLADAEAKTFVRLPRTTEI
ncbi:MAG TPA: hypothetical protein VF683_01800, partial [Chthoniobacterales bacterium]